MNHASSSGAWPRKPGSRARVRAECDHLAWESAPVARPGQLEHGLLQLGPGQTIFQLPALGVAAPCRQIVARGRIPPSGHPTIFGLGERPSLVRKSTAETYPA